MREAVRSGRRANFYITENSFIDHYAREVGPVGIAVYHVLERHMNCETRSTWIGTAKMAELLDLSQRTIQRTLKTLEDLKLIRILRTATMTTYVIVPVPPRPKTATVIPLFDQIPDQSFAHDSFADENSHDSEATLLSPSTSPESHSATRSSQPTTTMSSVTTSASHTRDTRDAAYKEEQNSLNKTIEQEDKSFPALQKSVAHIIKMLRLPITDSNRKTMTDAIAAALATEREYSGLSFQEAAEVIGKRAMEDRGSGVAINKFYFEDAKWRQARWQNGRFSKAEQRKLDNLEVNNRVKQRFRDLLGTP